MYKTDSMQLTVDINIDQLIQILKNLPDNQKAKIKSELNEISLSGIKQERSNFQEFLLQGPTMTDVQYKQFKDNRKKMNQWRTK